MTTLRTVTPDQLEMPDDQPPAAYASAATATATATNTTVSPPPSRHGHHSHPSRHGRPATCTSTPRALVARASSESDYRPGRDHTRPRTRTLDERSTRDRSPQAAALYTAGRHRIGSVAGTPASFQRLDEAVVTSIGHISTISPPAAAAAAHASLRRRPRPLPRSEPPVSPASPAHSSPEAWVAPVPASDARRLKALMRATCGRMQGLLAFRRGEASPWALSHCAINDEAGSLVYEPGHDTTHTRTLVPDLRGCRVTSAYDSHAHTAYLHVTVVSARLEIHLRPPTQEEFDEWLAALLCWSPMRPKGIQNRMAKPQAPVVMERRLTADSRRHSDVSLLKDAPKKDATIIKVGKMIYWDTSVTYSNTGTPKPASTPASTTGSANPTNHNADNNATTANANHRPHPYRLQSHGSRRWRRISCTLRENGELKLWSDSTDVTLVTLISTVQLSHLSRCAIQRLDPSVLDNEFCIAIYPQYTASSSALTLLRPVFLSLDSRVLYEVWIVLLRAFTVPQLYGPKIDALHNHAHHDDGPLSPSLDTHDMFRMEKSLFIRVMEARLVPPVSPKVADNVTPIRPSSSATTNPGGYLIEILLDGEIRARTVAKSEGTSPFWREEFEFLDLPALHTASLLLKKRPPSYTNNGDKDLFTTALSSDFTAEGGYAGISFDQTLGKTDIYLDDLGANQELEKWWPLTNTYGNSVGEVLVKICSEECSILMAHDYYPLSELLHRFSNSLTLQIAHMVPNELRRLSEYLLNIFQVSGAAGDWICALVEEEIDGTLRDSPASRLRFSKRLGSGEATAESSHGMFGSASDREVFLRDMGNNAKLEANLLFRGNTLLTKSLDLHMRRLGKEYLEETLSEKLREINEKDPECEVDPNRVTSQNELDRNWRRLINCTEEVWRAIYNSVARCPHDLRLIFRHIRACAEDRYGDYLRTVQYSSVSGFLFLRFFVPAVLNPKLFGLLKDHPKTKARRTFTLIAKSLQGLANMSSFGTKEAWMEPMNAFLTTHRAEFKKYLDDMCSISTTASAAQPIPPSYSTPIAILHRLPPTFKEGFPSLPYLIDHSRNFAMLVNLWLEHTKNSAHEILASDGDLLRFHNICVSLNERTKDCLNRAEPAERPSSSLSVKWEELVEQLQGSRIDVGRGAATRNRGPIQEEEPTNSPVSPTFGDDLSSSSTSTPITMQPPSRTRHQHKPSISALAISPQSNSSATISHTNPFPTANHWSGRSAPSGHDSIPASQSASTSASADVSDAEDTPPGSSDGLHMAPAPSYPQTLTQPSASSNLFNYSNPNVHINAQSDSQNSRSFNVRPRSAGGQSIDESENGSLEEEYTTALPAFSSKEGKDKEKKERGFRGVLPFQRKKRDKDDEKEKKREKKEKKTNREKDEEKEEKRDKHASQKTRDKDKNKSSQRSHSRSPERESRHSDLGGYADFALRSKPSHHSYHNTSQPLHNHQPRDELSLVSRRDRDEEF